MAVARAKGVLPQGCQDKQAMGCVARVRGHSPAQEYQLVSASCMEKLQESLGTGSGSSAVARS